MDNMNDSPVVVRQTLAKARTTVGLRRRSLRVSTKKQLLSFSVLFTGIFSVGFLAVSYVLPGSSPTFIAGYKQKSYAAAGGRSLLAATPSGSPNMTIAEDRCGGLECSSLPAESRQKFCGSDNWPIEAEIVAAGLNPTSTGAIYDFYCKTYGYPPAYDIFVGCGGLQCDALGSGGLLLPFLGMFYMFLGLAIVCDEFFVPALEVIVDRFGIDDDVAGATFMAAGGSAPELATALISTFIAPPSASDTGFGTIVGSAVFNVLFVIGACAIFSKGVLELSWWPLFRDSTCYMIGLAILAVFFGTGSHDATKYPASMEWYECMILLILYGLYVLLMKYNRWLHYAIVKKWLSGKKKNNKKKLQTSGGGGSTGGTPSNTKISPQKPALARRGSSRSVLLEQLARIAEDGPRERRQTALHFRAGILTMMVSEKSLMETAGIHLVTRVEGDVKATFRSVAGDSETVTKKEMKRLLKSMGLEADVSDKSVDACWTELDKNNDGSLDWAEFKEWYSTSEAKIWTDCETVFKAIDKDGDGKISRDELVDLLNQILGRDPEPEEIDSAWLELLSKASKEDLHESHTEKGDEEEMCIPQHLFNEWFAKSAYFDDRKQAGVQIEKQDKSFFPPWPSESIQAKVLYIVSLPLMIPLYLTIPNAAKPRFEKYFLLSFFLSITWIAIFACECTVVVLVVLVVVVVVRK